VHTLVSAARQDSARLARFGEPWARCRADAWSHSLPPRATASQLSGLPATQRKYVRRKAAGGYTRRRSNTRPWMGLLWLAGPSPRASTYKGRVASRLWSGVPGLGLAAILVRSAASRFRGVESSHDGLPKYEPRSEGCPIVAV
jgi:hypothetical protein